MTAASLLPTVLPVNELEIQTIDKGKGFCRTSVFFVTCLQMQSWCSVPKGFWVITWLLSPWVYVAQSS